MQWILEHLKAVLGGVIPFLSGLQIGFLENGLTASEFIGAVVAGLVGFGTVFGVVNKGQESAQEVVDTVKSLVSDDVKEAIEEVVPQAQGVLKTVS